MNIGEVVAKFKLDLKDFEASIGQATGGFQNLEGKSKSVSSSLKEHWVAASAAIVGGWMAIQKAMQYAEMGARAQQAEDSFRTVAKAAGVSADGIVAAMKRASAETIDDSDLMQKALKGMTQGLSGPDIIKITEIARVSARTAGVDVKTAYEEITDAIANQMPRALRRYGLITQEQMSLVNKAVAAGIEDINLLAVVTANAALKQAQMGEITKTTAEHFQEFRAQINELKETMGKGLIDVFKGIYDSFRLTAAAALYLTSAFPQIVAGIEMLRAYTALLSLDKERYKELKESSKEYWDLSITMQGAADDLYEKTLESNLKGLSESTKGSQEEIKAKQKVVEQLTVDMKAQIAAAELAKKLAAEREQAEKKIAEVTRKTNEEIDQSDQDMWEKELVRIRSEFEMYQTTIKDEKLLNDWLISQVTLADIKQQTETRKLDDKALTDKAEGYGKWIDEQQDMRDEAAREIAKRQMDSNKLEDKIREDDAKAWAIYYDDKQKEAIEAGAIIQKNMYEVAKTERRLREDIAKYTKDEFNVKQKLLDEELALYKSQGIDKNILDKWYAQQKRLLDEEQILRSNDFFAGLQVAYDQNLREQYTWGQAGADIFKGVYGAMTSTLTTFFEDVFKGKLKSAQEYFNSFKDMMIKAFAEMCAKMATQWLMLQAVAYGKEAWGWLQTAEEGMWEVKGGKAGEVPIMAHEGEMILPKESATAVRQYFSAGGGYIGAGTVGGALIGAYIGGMAGQWVGEKFGGETGGQVGGAVGTLGGAYLGAEAGAAIAAYLYGMTAAGKAEAASAAAGGGAGTTAAGTGGYMAYLEMFPYMLAVFTAIMIGQGVYDWAKYGKTRSDYNLVRPLSDSEQAQFGDYGFQSGASIMAGEYGVARYFPRNISTGEPYSLEELSPATRGFVGWYFRDDPRWSGQGALQEFSKYLGRPFGAEDFKQGKFWEWLEKSNQWAESQNYIQRVGQTIYPVPQYHGGIDYVPRTGPAMLEQGERVISREENIGDQPMTIITPVILNGREIARATYKGSRRGTKFIHERGLTAI